MKIRIVQREEIEKLRENNKKEILTQLYYHKMGSLFNYSIGSI